MRKKGGWIGAVLICVAVCLCLSLALVGGAYWSLRTSFAALRDPVTGLLVRIGEPAMAPLVQVLESPAADPSARAAAADALAQIGSENAIDHLVAALDDPDPAVSSAVVGALATIGRPALAPVVAALDNPAARPNAVTALLGIAAASDEPLDLAGVNLSDADLRSARFAGADLSGTDLSRADLSSADLSGANFSAADLTGANLIYADLTDANLADAVLTDAILTSTGVNAEQLASAASLVNIEAVGCDLRGAALARANLSGANFRKADASDADLSGANLTGAVLSQAILSGANLSAAILADTDLRSADLTGAVLDGANLSRARLDEADLTNASVRRANLVGAQTTDAVLASADLSETPLTPAQLNGAGDLTGVILRGLTLYAANLDGINLSGADLGGVNLNNATLVGARLDGANLSSAQLTSAVLQSASLREADLSGAMLERATLDGANLVGANLSGARLDGATLYDAIGLTDEMVEAAASVTGMRIDRLADILTALGPVCSGQGVEAGGTYEPGEGIHPLVILWEYGSVHDWTYQMPDEWTPTGLRFTQLVACVSTGEQVVEVCGPYYSGGQRAPDITRYRLTTTIRLLEPETARVVATRTFYGSYPRQCRDNEPYWLTELEGAPVTFADVEGWLEQYASP